MSMAAANVYNQNQQFTIVVEAENTNFATSNGAQYIGTLAGSFAGLFTGTSANTARVFAGLTGTVTANDNAPHSIVGVFNSSSSIGVVDGTVTTGLNAGTGVFSTSTVSIFGSTTSTLVGFFAEGGIWGSGFSSTQYNNMATNMDNYY